MRIRAAELAFALIVLSLPVDHTESHGCVRLTNRDAARVAALVKPGTAVKFR